MSRESVLEELRFLESNRTFLGREFLTWLWFVSESQNHRIQVPGFGEFMFFVDDKIVLSSPGGSVHENTLKGGTPAYGTEAQTALASGKLVQEAKFIMQQGESEWTWSMRADDLAFRGLRLPVVTEGDAAAHMLRRFEWMQLLTDVVDALYNEYMGIRLSSSFKTEAGNLATWIKSKNSHQQAEQRAPF